MLKMKKHILFAIRYSIIMPKSAAWATSSLSTDEQINKILSPERLDFRESMLDNITLPSIASNKCKDTDITVMLMVSDLLSNERIERLRSICRRNLGDGHCLITKIQSGLVGNSYNSYSNINDAMKFVLNNVLQNKNKSVFATVRIDDDDGVSSDYVSALSNYLTESLSGHLISFSYGLECYVKDCGKDFEHPRHLYFPKNAQGLAYINAYDSENGFSEDKTIHVFNTGNHTTVDERFPVIIDARRPMFFRTLSRFNDSSGNPNHDRLPIVKGKNIVSRFSFLRLYDTQFFDEFEEWGKINISKKCSYEAALAQRFNDRIKSLEHNLNKKNK